MRTPVPGNVPRIHRFIASLVLLLLIATSIVAQTQSTAGTIQGTVTDANGAVVPRANVEIRNLDTNFTRTITTNEDGGFIALGLPPGNYTVAVSKQGFATTRREKIELTVGQGQNLPFELKVSDVAETITITDNP